MRIKLPVIDFTVLLLLIAAVVFILPIITFGQTTGTRSRHPSNPVNVLYNTTTTIPAYAFDYGGENIGFHEIDTINTVSDCRTTDSFVDVYRVSGEADTNSCVVGHLISGEWLSYSIYLPAAGPFRALFRYSAPYTDNVINLFIDNTSIGTITLPKRLAEFSDISFAIISPP